MSYFSVSSPWTVSHSSLRRCNCSFIVVVQSCSHNNTRCALSHIAFSTHSLVFYPTSVVSRWRGHGGHEARVPVRLLPAHWTLEAIILFSLDRLHDRPYISAPHTAVTEVVVLWDLLFWAMSVLGGWPWAAACEVRSSPSGWSYNEIYTVTVDRHVLGFQVIIGITSSSYRFVAESRRWRHVVPEGPVSCGARPTDRPTDRRPSVRHSTSPRRS